MKKELKMYLTNKPKSGPKKLLNLKWFNPWWCNWNSIYKVNKMFYLLAIQLNCNFKDIQF